MELRATLFTRYDINPLEEYPHEYSDWADGPVVQRKVYGSDLERGVVDVQTQTRTIVTEGLHGVSRQKIGPIVPPRYPPLYVCQYDVDSSVLAAIAGDARFFILAVDDIGNGLPPSAEGRGFLEPIPQDVWDEFAPTVVAVTRNRVGDDQADQVDALQAQWWSRTPEAERTPEEYCLRLQRFTS